MGSQGSEGIEVREEKASAEAPPPRYPGRVLAARTFRLTCWTGLVAGLTEAQGHDFQHRFLGKILPGVLHPDAPWMTLTDDLVLFAIPGAFLSLAAWCWPRARFDRLTSAACAVGLLFALSDLIVVKEWPAAIVLSLGLAAAAARQTDRLQALARHTLWPLAGVAAVVAATVHGVSAAKEARADAALLPAAAGAPNVLLITLDTVRAESLSLYGYERPTTPRLERGARGGVCFDRAIATASWTLPSHASLFTGRFPREVFYNVPYVFVHGLASAMDDRYPTLAEFLARHGYRTSAFVANSIFCDRVYGLDRGFIHYDDYQISFQQIIKSAHLSMVLADWVVRAEGDRLIMARKSAADVNREFLRWLDRVGERPFFTFLNYMDAHTPYDPPPPFAGRFVTPGARPHAMEGEMRSEDSLRDEYDCCIAALDHQIGRLFDELARRGILDRTLIILTSDHGELIGDHELFGHGKTLFLKEIQVPLVLIGPGMVPAGMRVGAGKPVSLRDVPATVCDLLGLAEGAPFPGASLRRFWQAAPGEPVYSELDVRNAPAKPLRVGSVVDDRFHYIEAHLEGSGQPLRHLYDLRHDPLEEHDLADTLQTADVLARNHARLEQHDARMQGARSAHR